MATHDDVSDNLDAADGICPDCGGTLAAGATICASCGAMLPLASATWPAANAAASDAPAMPTMPMRRCDWCGAANLLDAERCLQCQATFPRAEMDAEIQRASAERVQAALLDLEARRKWHWWPR